MTSDAGACPTAPKFNPPTSLLPTTVCGLRSRVDEEERRSQHVLPAEDEVDVEHPLLEVRVRRERQVVAVRSLS